MFLSLISDVYFYQWIIILKMLLRQQIELTFNSNIVRGCIIVHQVWTYNCILLMYCIMSTSPGTSLNIILLENNGKLDQNLHCPVTRKGAYGWWRNTIAGFSRYLTTSENILDDTNNKLIVSAV